MFYSQNQQLQITKAWTVLFAVLFMTLIWQTFNNSVKAHTFETHKTAELAAAAPAKPTLTPEQIEEKRLQEQYSKAKFLSVVDTNEKVRYSNTDLFCMAKNIYHEAGSEPTLGKYAVAQVTINRMKSPKFGDKVCEVVFQPYQFSWANYHGRRWTTPSGSSWVEAKRIARDVLENGKRIKGMDDALYYHATYVRPSWAYHKDRLTRIGLHIFYEPRGYQGA